MKTWFNSLRLRVAGGIHRPLAGEEGGGAAASSQRLLPPTQGRRAALRSHRVYPGGEGSFVSGGVSQRLLPPTQGRQAAFPPLQGWSAAFVLALVCFLGMAVSAAGITPLPFYDDFDYADGTSLVGQQSWSVFTQGPGIGILPDEYHGWIGYSDGSVMVSNSLARLTGRQLLNTFGEYTKQPGVGPPHSTGEYDKASLVTVRFILDLSNASAPDPTLRTQSRINNMFWTRRWHYENPGAWYMMLPVVRWFVKDDGLISAYHGNLIQHLTHTPITGPVPITVRANYKTFRWSLWVGNELVVNNLGFYKTRRGSGEWDYSFMAHDGWHKDYDGLKRIGFVDNTPDGVSVMDRVRVFEGEPDSRAMPFIEDFETREVDGETITMELGNLNGQNTWFTTGAAVSSSAQNTNAISSGVQGGRINAGGEAFQLFLDAQTNVWTDLWMRPVASGSGAANVDAGGGHAVFYVNDAGELHAYDGETTTLLTTIDAGAWHRFTINTDYETRTWRLYLNGTLLDASLAFQGDGHGDAYEELRFWSTGSAVIDIDDMVVHTPSPFNYPTVSLTTDSIEIGTGVTQLTLTATLSWAFGQPITVDYVLQSDGTAMQVYGYNVGNGTFTFLPGETERSVTFTINRDSYNYSEHDDTLVFGLENLSPNVSLGEYGQLTYTVRTNPEHFHVIPFSESFEHRSVGVLDGQRGWQARYYHVQTADVYGGGKAGGSSRLGASMKHTFANNPKNITAQWHAKPVLSDHAPTPPSDSTFAFYVDDDGHIVAFNGTTATNMGDVVVLQPDTWAHFTVNADYEAKQWTLIVNDTTVLEDFAFFDDSAPSLGGFEVIGQGVIDDIVIDFGPPATPQDLEAVASDGFVTLNWSEAQGAVTYRVKRSTREGGPYSFLSSVSGTSFTDTSVLNGIRYYYVVSGLNENGEGNDSDEADAIPRARVTGVEAIEGIGMITLEWDAFPGATNYNVLRSESLSGDYDLLGTAEVNTLVDSNVVNGVTYYYRITADTETYTSLASYPISASPALRTIFYDSFEEPVIEGQESMDIPNWEGGLTPDASGSTATRVGLWNEEGDYSRIMTTPFGDQAASLFRHRFIRTTSIEETLEAGAFYLLTFNVAADRGSGNIYYSAALTAGDIDVATTTAGWHIQSSDLGDRSDSIAFTVPEDHQGIGQPLSIRIQYDSGNWEYLMAVDNVRLQTSIDPPPVLPDPLAFEEDPSPISTSAMSMTAQSATNGVGPILYLFENVTTGQSSGWSDSITWVNTGLAPGTEYGYRVKARDVYGNENTWSEIVYAETTGANRMESADESADSWNYGPNWNFGRPPEGEETARINAGIAAVVGTAPTNAYQGNLILEASSSMQFASADTAAVLPGSGYQIQLNTGSSLKALTTVDIDAAVVMLGDAEVLAGSGGNDVNFKGPISGSGKLTLAGDSGNAFHFDAGSTFSGGLSTRNESSGGFSVFANVNNAFGTGDVTINDYASLHRFGGLSSTIANTATLRLNGARNPGADAKVVIGGNETVYQLYVDGVVQPRGSHGSLSSNADHTSDVFSGSGLLWVTVGDDDIYALSTRNITESSAVLEGKLDVPFTSRVVRVYWSTTDNQSSSDWLNDPDAESAIVGTYSGTVGQNLVHGLIDLEENTPHYFTFSASNAVHDVIWGPTESFLTVGAPALDNPGVAATGDGNATLAGTLTAGSVADTTFVIGTSDAGTNTIFDWNQRLYMGLVNQDEPITRQAVNLIYGIPYFYRLYAENVIGSGWSGLASFYSEIPRSGDTILVGIAGAGVTDVTEDSVTLHGTLHAPRSLFTVHAYWSTNDYATAAEWEAEGAAQTAELGTHQNVNDFTVSHPISDLEPTTTYYYTFRITNAATNIWADVNREFGTKGPPTVGTADGAVDIGYGTATLQGQLLTGGVADAWFVWDEEDSGAASTSDWANVVSMGQQLQSIVFEEELSGLVYGVEYTYRAHVTNKHGSVWSGDAVTFTTGIPMDGDDVLVGITNTTVSGITGTEATIHGVLDATQSVFTVTAYWDTTNHGTNLQDWVDHAFDQEVGSFTNVMGQAIEAELSGLTADQRYYFTFVAANAATNLLAFPEGTFSTEGPPAASTAAGVTNVGIGTADLQAVLSAGGIAEASMAWGMEDGGDGELEDWADASGVGQVLQDQIFSVSVSNLLYGVTHYYRAYVTNSLNDAWSDPVATFTTLAPEGLAIRNTDVTDIELYEATFHGALDATQSVYTVYVFVSTNEHATAEAWRADADARSVLVDTYTNVVDQAFTAPVADLLSGTTYYYTFMASNVVDEIWAAPAVAFSTLDYPTVSAPGVITGIAEATLQGLITRFNGEMTDVRIYFGTSDGGDNPSAWDTNFVFAVESIAEGTIFTETVGDLLYGVQYYYRVYAANAYGGIWTDTVGPFYTEFYGQPILASGGTVTNRYVENDVRWIAHLFKEGGTFTTPIDRDVEYLIVGGGGGGGTVIWPRVAGGGGAGGLLDGTLSVAAGSYPVAVGAGGAGSTSRTVQGVSGGDSSVFDLTAKGGGGGGSSSTDSSPGPRAGLPGGSGGGGGGSDGTGGAGTASQGHNGADRDAHGGGGGGAYGPGSAPAGGPGKTSAITGTSVTYAAGGPGGTSGTSHAGVDAAAHTGGGGGGAAHSGSSDPGHSGGAGGSGIVVLRYQLLEHLIEPIVNTGADNITHEQADITAMLTVPDAIFTVTAYWSTNNHQTAEAWTEDSESVTTEVVGTFTNVLDHALQVELTGLEEATQYYYTFAIHNDVTEIWATPSATFRSAAQLPPVIDTADGATAGLGVATLEGVISEINGMLSDVIFYFGTSDGGTNPDNWETNFVFDVDAIIEGETFSTNVTDLLYGVAYYYTVYATNAYGADWTETVGPFTTLQPDGLSITNTAASAISATNALLHGVLDATQSVFTVTAYWSTTDHQSAAAWESGYQGSVAAGTFTNVTGQSIQATATNLTQNTNYYYAFKAENAATEIWAFPNAAFRTQGAPAVDNAGGVTNLTPVSATLRGMLTEGGVANAWFVWGTAVPGDPDVLTDWEHQDPVGTVSQGDLIEHEIHDFLAITEHFYRVYVTNDIDHAWSDVVDFTTPEVINVMTNNAGGTDSWNTAANWYYGHVPRELDQAVIHTNVSASADNANTPTYAGPLVLESGARLDIRNNIANLNALGESTVTLNSGTSLVIHYGAHNTFAQDFVFAGNASISNSGNSTDNKTRTFTGVLSGSGQFSYSMRRGNILALSGDDPNTWTGGLVVTNSDYLDTNRSRVEANKTGALGGGDVTINDGVSLIVGSGLSGTMSTNAVLALNGRPHNTNAKLVLNSSETVYQLWIDGVQQPGGVYTSSEDWLSGSGTLTVRDWPILLSNTSAQHVEPETADLEGTIDIVNKTVDVLVYWSTNNNADADAWLADLDAHSQVVDAFSSPSGVTGAVVNLTPMTEYYYTLRATNAYEDIWAEPNATFITPGPPSEPVVTTADGASHIGVGYATLNGLLIEGGSGLGTFVWGTTDGGTNSVGDWQHEMPMGQVYETFVFSTEITDLIYERDYIYRVYVTNTVGAAWSEPYSFATLPPAGLAIVNAPVENRQSSAVDLRGMLHAPQASFTVTAFWSTNDYATTAEWEATAGTADLGTFTNVLDYALTVPVSGLEETTTYYYTFRAANELTNLWSGTTHFETTPSAPPVVGLAGGAIPSVGAATLQGVVSTFNGILSDVRIYYGASDGGTNSEAWDTNSVINVSSIVEGETFAANVPGLPYGVPYFYAVYAENEHGGAWSTATNFSTLLPTEVLAELRVDFNREDQLSQQTGWQAFSAPDSTATVERQYASSMASSDDVTVQIEGMTHWRRDDAITGTFSGLSELLRDGPIHNGSGDQPHIMTLTLRDLSEGSYDIVTYNHRPSTSFGGGDLTLTFTDANVTDALVYDGGTTIGTSPSAITTNAFTFVSNGSDDVVIHMTRTGSGGLMFNGFELFQIVDAVGITATEAVNVIDSAADLQGVLEGTQSVFTVTAYWSTNDHATAEAWLADGDKGSALVGTFTNVVEHPVVVTATGLEPETSYYYTLVATNAATSIWAVSNANFVTASAATLPVVNAGDGVIDVGVGRATVSGQVSFDGHRPLEEVRIYVGTSDGGENTNSWDQRFAFDVNTIEVGETFSTNVTGLIFGETYYYRVYAENEYGAVWSDVVGPFYTVGSVDAPPIEGTIAWDFNNDDGVVSTNELADEGVVANDATAAASGGGKTARFANNRAEVDLGTVTSLGTGTFTFTIEVGSTPISLTNLDFITGVHSTAGSAADNYYKWEIEISVGGASASQSEFAYYASGNRANESQAESVTLSGLENLSNTSVTFTFTGYYGTNDDYTGGQNTGRWTFIDDVSFTAEMEPDPVIHIGVENTAATNMTATTADLQGVLDAEQATFTVVAYWSTNNHESLEAWQADTSKGVAVGDTFTDVMGQGFSIPATGLTAGTTYYYTLVASNAVTTIWSGGNTSFETREGLDVASFSPGHAVGSVQITVAPRITFADPVQKGTGTIEIWLVGNDGAPVQTIDVASEQVSISDGTVTIALSQELAYSTTYSIVVPEGAFEASGGGAVSTAIAKGEWEFTTRAAPGDGEGSVFRFR